MVYMGSMAARLEALSTRTAHSEDCMATPSEATVACMEDWAAYMVDSMATQALEDTAANSDLVVPSEFSEVSTAWEVFLVEQ